MAILYLKDWDRYPTAIADVTTKNHTWLDQAEKYREMGVKNWFFHLALLNPSLQGIDPYSEILSEDTQALIILECLNNPWYALREVMRIEDGDEMIRLRANRGNIAMFWCMFNSFITYMQQIRQTGKTFNARFLMVLFHMFMREGATGVLFTKGDLRKDEIKNYKKYRNSLPKWMWYLTKKDTDNQYEFTTNMNLNITYSYVPQGSEDEANGVGRGKTPDLVIIDEPPFLPYCYISIPALIASTTASFDKARERRLFHGIIYTTTAGDLSTKEGRYVYDNIKKKGMFFTEALFDCLNRDAAIDMIMINSKCDHRDAPHVDISFNHLQLGYTNDWLKGKIATVPGSIDQIKRDFLGQWTFGSTSNPIPEKLLRRIRENINPHPLVKTDPKYRYNLKFHVDPEDVRKRRSILGLDTSNAVGRDAITGVLIDVETGETLMTFMVSESSLSWFATWFAGLIEDFPLMTVVPEAKSSWIGILDHLMTILPTRGIDPGRRIYSRVVDNFNGTESQKRDYREYSGGVPTERKYMPYRNDFGFPTSGTLREELYVRILREATVQGPTLVRDSMLIDELSSLVERNGRIDHKVSGHDDHVISWLLAHWFLRQGRHPEHYGIDSKKIMSRVKSVQAHEDPKAYRMNQRQEKLKLEIEIQEDRLDLARNIIEIRYIEARIASLRSELRTTDEEDVVSVARKSEQGKELRQTNARSKGKEGIFSKFNPFTYRR